MIRRTAFIILLLIPQVWCLTCLQCKGIPQPRHCKIVVDCYSGEVCGVERVRNTFGENVYNIGCMAESGCQNLSSVTQGHDGCHECCRFDLCNHQGCGEPGYPQNRGTICYSCPIETTPSMCHDIAFCEPGDVCKSVVQKEFGDTVYASECSSPHECKDTHQQGTGIIGRDLTNTEALSEIRRSKTGSMTEEICSGCCDQDLCNTGCNETTLITDHCYSSPCQHGRCESTAHGFKCLCDNYFTGTTCETRIGLCSNNPCGHGKCYDIIGGLICICDTGYEGLFCEKTKATDCYDIYKKDISKTSGVYNVTLWRSKQTVQVYCDMSTYPFGWTVFQKRFDGSVDFYRNFTEYTNGFGDVNGEFWLGLRYVEEMAAQYESDLRVDVTGANNSHVYEQFENFSLSKHPSFTLNLGLQTVETIPDNHYGFYRSKGYNFSTFDHDVDASSYNCAEKNHGGWWYWNCIQANLNGEYITPPGGISSFSGGLGGFVYYTWKHTATLKSSQIMFRKHD